MAEARESISLEDFCDTLTFVETINTQCPGYSFGESCVPGTANPGTSSPLSKAAIAVLQMLQHGR